jgi:hypothetical protein
MMEGGNMSENWSVSFAADRLPEALKLVGKASKRLVKAGGPAFDPIISAPFDKIMVEGGVQIAVPYVTLALESLKLSIGDFTFVAALVPEEAGWTVHAAPGQSLDGWKRPDVDEWPACDHCHTDRKRVRVYVVRDDRDGKLIQLGHNCIQLYTGIEPKGLWALGFDMVLEEFAGRDEGGFGGGGRDYGVRIDEVLALSFAYSQGGRAYVSKARADEWGKEATVDLIRMHLFSPPKAALPGSRGYEAYAEYLEAGAKAAAVDDALLAAIKASADTLKAGSDYGDNMAIILAAESGYVSRRNVGVLASLVAVYRRGLEQEESRKVAPAASGFLGKKGDKLKGLEVTAKIVREQEGFYGPTTWMVAKTDSGHEVVWSASGARNWEPGDRIKIGSATVKDQKVYQGVDQTIITNGRGVEVLAAAAA